MSNEAPLVHAGLSIADGDAVDWDALGRVAGDDEEARRLLRELRRLEEIMRFFHTMHSQPGVHSSAGDAVRDNSVPGVTSGSGDNRPSVSHSRVRRGHAGELVEFGDLEILERIGVGGFGEVYRARDRRLDRIVAVKLLRRPELAPRTWAEEILSEGRLLARVRHPNVVEIFAAERVEEEVALVMELVAGRSLARWIRDDGPLGANEAALAGIDLCSALAAVHAADLLHGDVKAENVVREVGGRIVLMDFGTGSEHEQVGERGPEGVSGTPAYMAPEVLRGEPPSPRSDLYSLGVLLYHLVTGSYPYAAASLDRLREAHARGEARRLRDLRPSLPTVFVDVIEQALAANPVERFATAGEMERALMRAVGADALAKGSTPSDPLREDSSNPAGTRKAPADLDRLSVAPGFRSRGEGMRMPDASRRLRPFVTRRRAIWSLAAALLAGGGFVLLRSVGSSPSYTIEASLYKRTSFGAERLLPGARVAPGEGLYLDLAASRDLWVYVLAEDDRGESFLLFPLPGHDLENPVPRGGTHRLPPSREGRAQLWGVSSQGGREHLLLVASPERLSDLEREIAQLPLPRPEESSIELGPASGKVFRGLGKLMEDRPSAQSGARRLADIAERLGAGATPARGVFVRQIDLENPGGP